MYKGLIKPNKIGIQKQLKELTIDFYDDLELKSPLVSRVL